jgi:hypothetical protein
MVPEPVTAALPPDLVPAGSSAANAEQLSNASDSTTKANFMAIFSPIPLNDDGIAIWRAILWAICELQREHPRKGEPMQ